MDVSIYNANNSSWLSAVFFHVAINPMLQLYLFGPSILGFWEGQRAEDICNSMTNIPSRHWENNIEECFDLIYRRFNSYVVLMKFMSVVITITGGIFTMYILMFVKILMRAHVQKIS